MKMRYVIGRVTFDIAMPVPSEFEGAEYLDNKGIEHYANNEADIIEEFLPMIQGQLERHFEKTENYGTFKIEVLRDATNEDKIEFLIP